MNPDSQQKNEDYSIKPSEVRKIQHLILTGGKENFDFAMLLLETLGVTKEQWPKIFTDELFHHVIEKCDFERISFWINEIQPLIGQPTLSRLKLIRRHLNKLNTLSTGAAKYLLKCPEGLAFSRLKVLEPDVAQILSKYQFHLQFPGVKWVSDETAATLANFRTTVELNNLTSYSEKAAFSLAKLRFFDFMGGFEKPSSEFVKKVIRKYPKRTLRFSRMKTLLPETAETLISSDSQFDLSNLKNIGAESAKIIANHKGPHLKLDGLLKISDKAAKALLHYKGKLSLQSLRVSSEIQSKLLVKKARFTEHTFDHIHELPEEWATHFEHAEGELRLPYLKKLTPETAALIARFPGKISLGIESLSPKVAEALCRNCTSRLELNNLRHLKLQVAEHLAKHKGDSISLDQIERISTKTADALACYKGRHLSLRGLTSIGEKTAQCLAKFPGFIRLNPEYVEYFYDLKARDQLFDHIVDQWWLEKKIGCSQFD